MRSILCYGDSNTWGAVPMTQLGDVARYAPNQRWTGILRQSLGQDFTVIEEGLNGRTTTFDDPFEGAHKNGKPYLLPCLETHNPIDLVIVTLGTNDLKHRFGLSANDIAFGAGSLLDIILAKPMGPGGTVPQMLLVCPAPLAKLTIFADMFEGATEKSNQMAPQYRAAAERRNAHFLFAGDHIISSDIDGVHLAAEQHAKLAAAIEVKVRDIFANA